MLDHAAGGMAEVGEGIPSSRAIRGKRNVRRATAELEDVSDDDKDEQGKESAPVTAEERAVAAAGLSPFVSKAEKRHFADDIRSTNSERVYLSVRCVDSVCSQGLRSDSRVT